MLERARLLAFCRRTARRPGKELISMRGRVSKRVWIGGIVAALILIGVLLFALFRRTPLREYYKTDRDTLERLSQILFSLREEKKVIVIDEGDDYLKYGEEAEALLTQVFSQAACDSIFVTTDWDGTNCCSFSIGSKTRIYGIIYAQTENINETQDAFPATSLIQKVPLSDHWLYYEALSYEEESKMPY